jgi:hypothetical protein
MPFGPVPGPPARPPGWALAGVVLVVAALAVVSATLVLQALQSPPVTTVTVCGHSWTVPSGSHLRITVTGPRCSDIKVTGG